MKHKSKPEEHEEIKESVEQELEALNDKYLRLYSEYDNYRKRSMRERAELLKTASSDVITLLLPVVDDFERALKAFPEGDPAYSALRDGISLIYGKLMNTLAQLGLEQMQTLGTGFDTDFHEAVTNIPSPTPESKGTILEEIQKGYTLNGKVIRFAKVVVGG